MQVLHQDGANEAIAPSCLEASVDAIRVTGFGDFHSAYRTTPFLDSFI
ncbi:hypothetical protein J14TS2_03620 [Bacillus sp. J14TS2]|nr:hypothetical protein J14TS2_03620 [Bacillus sp. J14TS2]